MNAPNHAETHMPYFWEDVEDPHHKNQCGEKLGKTPKKARKFLTRIDWQKLSVS